MNDSKVNLLSREELPPVNIGKLLEERGYGSVEISNLTKNDVLFFSSMDERTRLESKDELLTSETVEIKKILANELKDLKIEFPLDKRKTTRYVELLSAEIIIGLVVFLGPTAWEISKGVIANWIYDRFKSMRKSHKPLCARVEVQIIDKKKGRTYHFKYSGPADQVSEIIKKTEFK